MAIAQIQNKSGFLGHASAQELLASVNNARGTVGKRVVKLLTLYNPNTSSVGFKLQYRWKNAMGTDETVRRFDDTIAAGDGWTHGSLNNIMVIDMSPVGTPTYLELILDSAPTLPIEWSVDWADAV